MPPPQSQQVVSSAESSTDSDLPSLLLQVDYTSAAFASSDHTVAVALDACHTEAAGSCCNIPRGFGTRDHRLRVVGG